MHRISALTRRRAAQLKQSMTEDTPRFRFHLLKRLRRVRQSPDPAPTHARCALQAVQWSRKLVELCSNVADARTQLEVLSGLERCPRSL
jgi:hypothetical protein